MNKDNKLKHIGIELAHHLPYSMYGVTLALIFMGILSFFVDILHAQVQMVHASRELFHIFHPAHILFSAVATTAMFYKHDNQSMMKAIIVGLIGSITVCGISDMIVPFFGGMILGADMYFHLCIIDEPSLVYPFAIFGALAGLAVTKSFDKSTQYSHGTHVFLSSMASLLYLIAFGLTSWIHVVGGVFMVTVFAVVFPCCLSDIVFPMLCTHKYCTHSDDEFDHTHP